MSSIDSFNFNSHAHVERDLYFRTDKEFPQNFNSHAHVERDQIGDWKIQSWCISTHTLTWSVTWRRPNNAREEGQNFNSHAHVERDTYYLYWHSVLFHFNSHAHVERDRYNYLYMWFWQNFNSHAHVERDPDTNKFTASTKISTHTLTWSVTTYVYMLYYRYSISTHTLTWSVTVGNDLCALYIIFQLTRSRGAWRHTLDCLAPSR